MASNFQNMLLALMSHLKAIFFAFLAGLHLSPKLSTTTTTATTATGGSQKTDDSSGPAVDHDVLIARIAALADGNEAAARLHDMIAHDGAGSWPPRFPTELSTWPAPLRAYHTVYLASAPDLYTNTPSTSDSDNATRRAAFRARLSALLATQVDLSAVQDLLAREEQGGQGSAIPQDVLNAFFASVAMTRHAFRWATIPAVRIAQSEKLIDYPPALTAPWPFLQRRYGFGGQAGSALSNFLCSWAGPVAGPAYRINAGPAVAPAVERAEYWFAFMFAETERLALPVYVAAAEALVGWEAGRRDDALAAVRRMRDAVRAVVKVLYDNLVEHKVGRDVWLGWVQGFHAYGAGIENGPDGKYVESDGVSGNQLPFFQVVDAFLGMGAYLTPDESRTSVSVRLRRLGAEVRRQSFRAEAKEAGDDEMEMEMMAIAKQVRVWRAAHKVRIVPYLAQPAPERMLMMAGKSVLETKGVRSITGLVEYLDHLVGRRIEQTK